MLIKLIIVMSFSITVVAVSVSRYAGAMDKKANNTTGNQYATLIGNAAVVLLANNTFASSCTIETARDGSVTSTGTVIDRFDANEIYKIVVKNL